MKKMWKSVISILLIISLFLVSNVPVFAAAEEVYLSDLRLIYAEDYNEAKDILSDTAFKDYKLLNKNLNEGTKEIGVWLAYKTTTDIEDAITDLSIMQMNGGYKQGNYQEMIKESLEEYKKMCEQYEDVIEYFNTAYDEGYFLAELAHRQLNLYTVKTVGLDDKYVPYFEGELLGDIFYDGIDSDDLATMFMEGNTYVLNNIRSLLAMGASYNEDGLTYMEKVAEAAAEMNDDPDAFADEDYDGLAAKMVSTLIAIKDLFKELEAHEDDLNYNGDEEITGEELEYAENKTLANMMRDVDYLDGKTLYDFVRNYNGDKSDYTKLYPLVAALNEGQVALVNLLCYYNVIRYSMSDFPEEYLEEEVSKLEEIYGENPFNVYEGVDRTVFKGTFALTTAAYRNDAYNDTYTLADAFFGNAIRIVATTSEILIGGAGIGLMLWGAYERGVENSAPVLSEGELLEKGKALFDQKMDDAVNAVANQKFDVFSKFTDSTCGQSLDKMLQSSFPEKDFAGQTFYQKFQYLQQNMGDANLSGYDQLFYNQIDSKCAAARITFDKTHNKEQFVNDYVQSASSTGGMAFSSMLLIAGGAMLLASALGIIVNVVSYYNPDYSDIPLEMVDLIETEYGDRYIKYDVVREAEERAQGVYAAGDLNAYEAQRWNALYYTKSYEAGKPLLADEFVVSTTNNKAKTGYAPVHGFGEVVCYDLNKYNFSNKTGSIYLSVKQSKNDKSAVADVPQVVGSIFANGIWLLIGGAGALVGVGGTIGTQALFKKKRTQSKKS